VDGEDSWNMSVLTLQRSRIDLLRGPQREIEASTDNRARANVDPKHDLHDIEQPRPTLGNSVLAHRDENCCNARHSISIPTLPSL
jgi:hypothetical protein